MVIDTVLVPQVQPIIIDIKVKLLMAGEKVLPQEQFVILVLGEGYVFFLVFCALLKEWHGKILAFYPIHHEVRVEIVN